MFSYEMPTKLYFGKGCVAEAGDDVKRLPSYPCWNPWASKGSCLTT